ncbi:putative transcriptional response regulator protein [Desulforapulum autotrophicum HRM2]|uniref:Transcriptional response regulator protein n=1 Tax=Desulforapulum autotrophicum (strain ATCC 43914 / DSM 3382 / VKM B-1955 / HRM2) TaxID=177437 RepID=C0QM99_DESAH|nr:response regulator [Desulforapulum autotrophicum]ACN16416.1 putative transcriptional response regulator protein [Desulforapulum autotrophicum HRM2]
MNDKLILIIEDNEKSTKLVKDLLQYKGYRTVEAVNGLDGIESALKYRPQLILMDIQMPVMDGLEATRKLKEMPETRSIPVVALTSWAMKGDEKAILEAGCDDYMSKPINTRSFIELVDRFFNAS